ncbi:tripartite tricarboxylate transporter substrate binding protein [Xylophilus sp. GOD-11R]|uniref:Bug family tripartite tricarboxylate transporter substrate binding protein n=1 Tax=Xylophilus sp. GOD-11R TaxID=3089814 RepID=UPI00298CB69F|nr:tripartite tricarboxylate transporter substrate binding protein [Xylophilus sp. GOD-11R]WPB55723.1 tripartite tricarboxylate transporter substrate binding protein [Xylophilus sp. GOD-11R]
MFQFLDRRPASLRRRLGLAALFAAIALPVAAQAQEKFPTKPIHVVVPFPPGGINDTVARPILKKMGELMNIGFVIDNRPGASGTIGTASVARADPDGYTLLLGAASTMAVVPHMMKSVPYSSSRDFAPIGGLASVPSVMISGRPEKYPDFAAVLADLKKRPGEATYGSAGPGTSHHTQMSFLNLELGTSMLHVPYKGSGPAMADLLGGQIDFLMDPLPTTITQVGSGKIVPIAITSAKRSALLPNVPTFIELGVKGFEVSTWFGLFAPVKTPPAVLAALTDALSAALADPAIVQAMASRGMDPLTKNPAEMARYVADENMLWKGVIEKTRIGLD